MPPRNLPWRDMRLAEEEKKLCNMAKDDRHCDYGYLFALERQKLIYLLPFIDRDGKHVITEEKVDKMNCINLHGLAPKGMIDNMFSARAADNHSCYLDAETLYRKRWSGSITTSALTKCQGCSSSQCAWYVVY